MRAQSYAPIEDAAINEDVGLGPNVLGPNVKDGHNVQDAVGPNVQDVLNAAFAADAVFGPNKDAAAADGPNEAADVRPHEDAGPIDLTTTPKPFVDQPHFIRSNNPRSSTGYKGIVKDKRGGWRAKWSGKHIGRYENKMEACQAYYEYCVEKGLIGPR